MTRIASNYSDAQFPYKVQKVGLLLVLHICILTQERHLCLIKKKKKAEHKTDIQSFAHHFFLYNSYKRLARSSPFDQLNQSSDKLTDQFWVTGAYAAFESSTCSCCNTPPPSPLMLLSVALAAAATTVIF